MDPLSLSIGPNEGSAAVLGKGNFQDFSKDILAMRYKEAEESKMRNAKTLALMQENLHSQFAQDDINYFQPKMDEIRNYTTDLFKKRNGMLNEMDMFDIQTKWNKLKSEAELSNNLYKEEAERLKEVENDPQGLKYDTEQSAAIRKAYMNPWSDPKLAKEVEQAGGIVKWRAQNSSNYRNVAAYDLEKDYQDSFGKDKLSRWYEPNWVNRGGFKERRGYEGIAPDADKFQQRVSQVWNRTDYRGRKFREYHGNWVANNFSITDEGIAPNSEAAKQLLAKIPNTKGLTAQQKFQQLAFAHAVGDTEARFPTKEIAPLTERNPDVFNFGNGAGGNGVGAITEDKINVPSAFNVPGYQPEVAGAQFTTTPFKTLSGLSSQQIDLSTGKPVTENAAKNIQYGQLKVLPVLTADAILYKDGKAYKAKKGHILTSREAEELETVKVAEGGGAPKFEFKVYAIGNYNTKGGGGSETFDLNSNPSDYRSVITPAETIYQSALDAVSDKEKKIFMQNYLTLKGIADGKNGYESTQRNRPR